MAVKTEVVACEGICWREAFRAAVLHVSLYSSRFYASAGAHARAPSAIVIQFKSHLMRTIQRVRTPATMRRVAVPGASAQIMLCARVGTKDCGARIPRALCSVFSMYSVCVWCLSSHSHRAHVHCDEQSTHIAYPSLFDNDSFCNTEPTYCTCASTQLCCPRDERYVCFIIVMTELTKQTM